MGKDSLERIPLFGIFFKKGMDISVNRGSIRDSQRALDRAKADLQNGISIAIFPEGTVSADAPQLRPFKNGPFKLAAECGVEIVPLTFYNNWLILPDEKNIKKGGRPGIVKVKIHKPIPIVENSDAAIKALKIETYNTIAKSLTNAN